ncbi:TPA: hypothetical protein N0F65_010787 [Lagenidium giganteum]|uniref:Pseudouridine synthase RsuA/RluA-like domain-containing protein n=1 Tax=Lagenidium giganteum TaxID=4803 RepID=A0AAV2YU84_9STRA|nr:TPA: hypothetical protein N0F65_010787 [Lagenidium giganteum]
MRAEVQVTEPDAGTQWTQLAARAIPALTTTSKAKREWKRGRLRLNGCLDVPTNVLTVAGDVIEYDDGMSDIASAKDMEVADSRWFCMCQRQGLRVVFENDSLAVVMKPPGVHVKGRGPRTLESALPRLLRRRTVDGGREDELPVPHAVHRLDYRVGGVLLVAKRRQAEVMLGAQFERHQVIKHYRALVVGRLQLDEQDEAPCGGLSTAIPTVESASPVRFISTDIDGKTSCTALRIVDYSRSASYEWLTTVDLWPLTGRKHQLRLHLARVGHPIVGDDLYHIHVGEHTHQAHIKAPVVRGVGLFLTAIGVAFDDEHGNRRSFAVAEPPKYDRFRHMCEYNWTKMQQLKENR